MVSSVALARPPLAADQISSGRIALVDKRTVLNPVSYWLDRPRGSPRAAAAMLARRIATEAGLPSPAIEAFLAGERTISPTPAAKAKSAVL